MKASEYAALQTIELRRQRKRPGDNAAITAEVLATWKLLDLLPTPPDVFAMSLTYEQQIEVDAMLGGGL